MAVARDLIAKEMGLKKGGLDVWRSQVKAAVKRALVSGWDLPFSLFGISKRLAVNLHRLSWYRSRSFSLIVDGLTRPGAGGPN
jgi:hypothetical protein